MLVRGRVEMERVSGQAVQARVEQKGRDLGGGRRAVSLEFLELPELSQSCHWKPGHWWRALLSLPV